MNKKKKKIKELTKRNDKEAAIIDEILVIS